MSVKANQWLLDNGFIERITRGRRSRENNIRLHEAHLSGIRFSDWEPDEGTDSKGEYTTRNATPIKSATAVVGDIRYTYPEAEWEAEATVNGKKISVSMREICSTCGVSLVGHGCANPGVRTVICDGRTITPVVIVKRKTPLKNKLW